MKEYYLRKLRYNECRLSNGIKEMSITDLDIQKRKDAIEFANEQLMKIDKAEELLRK